MTIHDSSHCLSEVRRYDNDRYLTALFAPEDRRAALFALYAFNLEIAKTRETVSEPMLGQIRLQWWRETIDGIYKGDLRGHEVAAALGDAVHAHGVSRAYLDRMIDGRELDLTDDPPENIAALERYAEDTSSTVMMAALEILGVARGDALEAARLGGIAWAIAGLLRTVPFHASQGRVYIPADLLSASGLTAGNCFRSEERPRLIEALTGLHDHARRYLDEARRVGRSVPAGSLAAILPVVLAEAYLRRIARARFDVFAPGIGISRPGRQMRLLLAAWRRKF